MIIHLGIQEGSKYSDGSSKSIDGLDRSVEDDDGGDYNRYTFHGVANAKCQGRDLIKGHVWDLIVEMIENTLGCHPPIKYNKIHKNFVSEQEEVKISYIITIRVMSIKSI